MRVAIASLLLLASCAGDPFELADAGAAPLVSDEGAAVDGAVDAASVLDGQARAGEASAAVDAISETNPPVSDGGGGNDGPAEAFAEAQAPDAPSSDAMAPDSAPPPALCCIGAGQASCSAAVRCYGPASSCSAMLVYGPDGGQYQTATCTGSASPCSDGCAAGSACLWAGSEPGQWLPGSIEACP